MTWTLCCATTHRAHSYHTAPNALCGCFIPLVKLLFISPALLSLPHTCFIFSPTPTSHRLIVSITSVRLWEHSPSFVFLIKNKIMHITYSELHMHHCTILGRHQSPAALDAPRELHWDVKWAADSCNSGIKAQKGVCHICPLLSVALTASDNSFHQPHRRAWQPVKEKGEKVPLLRSTK